MAEEAATNLVAPDDVVMEKPAAAPEQEEMDPNSLEGLLSKSNKLFIDQKLDLLEAVTQGICERANSYKIMTEEKEHILTAKEVSPGLARCCCAPYHSTLITFERESDKEVLLTLERQGCNLPTCQRCPGCCCACMDFFKDNIKIYPGKVEGTVGELTDAPPPIAFIEQATCGGGIWPKLNIFPDGDNTGDSSHTITGPACFGGCSELCMTATYTIENNKTGTSSATLTHLTPKDAQAVMEEICTDVDHFAVEFNAGTSGKERVLSLGAAMLLDYMFFEMDNGMLSCKGGKQLDITCFIIHCFGCFCPCKITLGGEKGGGEGGGDTE